MRAVASLNVRNNPFLLPGVHVRTSARDRFPLDQGQLQRWRNNTWSPLGKGRLTRPWGESSTRGDVDTLSDYRAKAPGMPYAHPTVEHYTPLFVTLGAATTADDPGIQVIDGYWMGLSKRSLQVA